MRRPAALAAILFVAVPGALPAASPNQPLADLAGKTNMEAVDAAAGCRNAEAMDLAGKAAKSRLPGERLFAELAQAAILSDAGKPDAAAAIIDAATGDPALNPDGASRAQMQQGADALLLTIRTLREAATGKPTC